MDNPRIGLNRESGVVWPEQDLRGHTYSKPPGQTLSIGNGQFVVVPMGMTTAEIEAAVADLRGGNVAQARTNRRGAVTPDEQSESNS
jgi:hypothetical protein